MMKLPLWLCAWLLALELVIILLLVPGGWTDHMIQQESALIKQQFGAQGSQWIEEQASKWFQSSMVDSGIYPGIRHAFLPRHKKTSTLKAWKILRTPGLPG